MRVLWECFILALCIPIIVVFALAVGIELLADWLSRKAESAFLFLLERC